MKKLRIPTKQKHTFEQIIKKACKKAKVKGANFAIVGPDKTYFSYQYGTVDETGEPNDPKQHMMIGSSTKMLTALAILKLHDDQLLKLDDPITQYLPTFSIQSRLGDEAITIRQLLMHTSGLPGDDYPLITSESNTLSDTLDVLKKHYRTTKPNTMYAYSNLGYSLLGLIIESASNSSYTDYLKTHIFKPLKLEMKILETKKKREQHSDILSQSFDRKGQVKEDPLSTLISAGSSTYSTLDDLIKLMQFFMNKDPINLLRKDTLKMMLDCPDGIHKQVNSERVGLGLRHRYYRFNSKAVGPVFGHGGNTIYHHSTFDIFPKLNIGFIAMTNSELGVKAIMQMNLKIMLKVFKLLGIRVPKRKYAYTIVDKELPESLKQSFLSPGLNITYKPTKSGKARYKMQLFTFTLTPCHDGYYRATPRGIIARLPLISRVIKGLRFRPESVGDRTVLYLEMQRKYHRITMAFATNYEPSNITQAWEDALGRYKPYGNENNEKLLEFAELKKQKDNLILRVKMVGQVMNLYLKVINDHEAIIQGYGRNARETVFLESQETNHHLRVFGLACTKEK